jgi:integrase
MTPGRRGYDGHRPDTADMNNLNEETVKALAAPERGNKIYYFAGAVLQGVPAPKGFGVRVTAAGARAFVLNYQLRGREYRFTIGQYPTWTALKAVREARELRQRIDRGDNPLDDRAPKTVATVEAPKTVADVIEDFIRRHVNTLRTAKSVESALRRLVLPAIGSIPVYDLRRRHIAAMLDTIEEQTGAVQASRVVAYVTKCFNWYATRDDEFTSPMIRGMARSIAAEHARDRVLSDDEIRLIWPQLDDAGTFGALVKMLLLTGQRRGEVAGMRRSEIGPDGVWTIPAARYKTKRAHAVPLSAPALAVIEARPKSDVVFASVAGTPFNAYDKPKRVLDKATGTSGWTLHDLRRTAKTLMQRAGVRPDISERVLGHAQGAIESTYDRHSYLDEKREALEKLAAMVDRILNPPTANVVTIRQEARA